MVVMILRWKTLVDFFKRDGYRVELKKLKDKRFEREFNQVFSGLIKESSAEHKKKTINGVHVWTTIPCKKQYHNIRCQHRSSYSVIRFDELLKYEVRNNTKLPVYKPRLKIVFRTEPNFLWKLYLKSKEKLKDAFKNTFLGFEFNDV